MPTGRIGSNATPYLGFWIALAFTFAPPIDAAEITVSNAADTGSGSLRQAIDDSNESTDTTSRISFSPAAPGLIEVLTPFAAVEQDLTIDGAAATSEDLLVRGPGAGSVLYSIDAGGRLALIDAPFELGDVLLGADSALTFDTSSDQTVDSVIREEDGAAGAVRKQGTGELRLTGENAYTGVTTVSEGTLVITNTTSGTSLPGAVALEANGILAFDGADATFELASDIAGTGGFEKRGTSTLRMLGQNSYSGVTQVLAGKIVGAPLNIPGNTEVSAGATLELSGAFLEGELFEGAITGPGTLQKSGTGTLNLTAANDIGSIEILEGTLTGDAAALTATSISIAESASLDITEGSDGVLSANLTGAGSVVKSASGTAKLSGNNSVATLHIKRGRLVGTRPESIPQAVSIDGIATLTFNPTNGGTYSGVITGAGDLEKRGGATLKLTGAHTFTGNTEVRGGLLELDGSLVSSVDVLAGASLSGTGRIDNLLTTAGTLELSPDDSLSVADVALAENAQLDVSVSPELNSTLLSVDNTATLDPNSRLDLQLLPGDYASNGQTFTLVSAGNLIGVPIFDSTPLFYDLALTQAGNKLLLQVTPNNASFEQFATNRNQDSVARSLDIEKPTATADLNDVMNAIEALSSEIGNAYDQLSGEQMSQLATVRLEMADRLDRSLLARLRERREPSQWAAQEPTASKPDGALDATLWLEPFAVFGDIDGRSGSKDTDYTLSGITVGGDLSPFEGGRVGAAFSYGHGKLDTSGLHGSAETNSFFAALYGGWTGSWLRLGLTTRLGYSDMESDRKIRLASLNRTAKGDFSGLGAGGRFEAGVSVFQTDWVLVEPFVSASYTHLERGRIDERGADSVNLHIAREKIDAATVGAGLRLRARFVIDGDLVFAPEVHSEWSQQLADRDRRLDGAFQDALAGSTLRVYGTELKRNAGLTGVAWVVRSTEGLEARFGYDVGYDADRVAHSVAVSVTASW